MRHDNSKDRKAAGVSDATHHDSDLPVAGGEIVPWEAGPPAYRDDDDPALAREHDAPEVTLVQQPTARDTGPKLVRVRRSVILWLVCLLVVAALVIVGLVRYLPARTAKASSVATNSAQPSVSATPSSPAASASGTGASPGATSGTSTGASASPGTSATAEATTSAVAADGGGPGAPIADLSALTPLSQNNVSTPTTGPEQIGATTYQDSVRFTCDTYSGNSGDVVYDVASYKFLTAMIGIPSNASNAAGNAMTITFYKDGSSTQLSTPVTVSLDHPQSVHLNLQDSSQLEISCNAINTTSQSSEYMDVALGNATIGPS
jgi:hypothetical protein